MVCACCGTVKVRSIDYTDAGSVYGSTVIRVTHSALDPRCAGEVWGPRRVIRKRSWIEPGTAKATHGILVRRHPELAGISSADLLEND